MNDIFKTPLGVGKARKCKNVEASSDFSSKPVLRTRSYVTKIKKTAQPSDISRTRSVSVERTKSLSGQTKCEQNEMEDLENSFTEKLSISCQVDDFFLAQRARKMPQSRITLARLGQHRLSSEKAEQLLSSLTQTDTVGDHCKSIFPRIFCQLEAGFNVILHGLGSKKTLLEEFRRTWLKDENCAVIPGYFTALNMQQTLMTLVEQFVVAVSPHTVPCSRNPAVLTESLRLHFSRDNSDERLYLLVPGLDGVSVRGYFLSVLNRLASAPRISVLGTTDHIHADMMLVGCSNANWLWAEASTLVPHSLQETGLLSDLGGPAAASGSASAGNAGMASLRAVMHSVPQFTKRLFLLLARHRCSSSPSQLEEGMPLELLYRRCRDDFLTASELGLRQQLTEFRDHKLVHFKGFGVAEYVKVDLDNATLKEFCDHFDDF